MVHCTKTKKFRVNDSWSLEFWFEMVYSHHCHAIRTSDIPFAKNTGNERTNAKDIDNITRLHPRGKGGPEGALVWITFKSLKLSSDRVRQTDVRWI